MALFRNQPPIKQNTYLKNIENIAKLSGLFSSESAAPFLVSRATENIFEESLGAKNLGRDDTAIDAILDNVGIGIKTFLHGKGHTLQKVAEFNRDSTKYRNLSKEEMILIISKLRNERLQFAIDNYNVADLIYHCITRKPDGTINFYEAPMNFINTDKISNIKLKQNSISFQDDLNEYSFNLTKSTLYKRFPFRNNDYLVASISVKMFKNPFSVLNSMLSQYTYSSETESNTTSTEPEYIVLPLYSYSKSAGKFIAERSGLNQWNANGRKRDPNEIYIPVSRKIHDKFPDFFPNRDTPFSLHLPNGDKLKAKISQSGDKALMSNPNKALGGWLLRDILHLPEEKLLTYSKLSDLGIDAVKIEKNAETDYSIDFCEAGTYDHFANEYNL
ncbi:restriction endonuclease PLD domain-containing protein [Listeria seeligeri]|uniref:restriction endonuclease PLD domain-containing protein n=1 Tax=Listeria seeligeri TaxID=1640 RepID=UPI0010EEE926|nr:restriction endonuclease PLD domain-containing protein [Listeria seeligeri]MBC1597290.1 NgoFVII family restriction endonuclease [Listeria seeligeri]MBC1737239.1 NgoFVII family restriction endonuclease [Listeria seeligeri]MBF2458898.1 NgoFVII family restriction endonuclease [Listeria seeligeri]MBF2539457.1 NgoFVII family restriction endonuclease [Listeria seeligeri]MBF2549133.1 NgoFVII family restriction endonuclease [Listeria seeligeri]